MLISITYIYTFLSTRINIRMYIYRDGLILFDLTIPTPIFYQSADTDISLPPKPLWYGYFCLR